MSSVEGTFPLSVLRIVPTVKMADIANLRAMALQGFDILRNVPLSLVLLFLLTTLIGGATFVYFAVFLFAPIPRPPRPSEKTFITVLPDGTTSTPKQLPCWLDTWQSRSALRRRQSPKRRSPSPQNMGRAEVFMSVVVPAYNEEDRIGGMLEEAVDFLQTHYGDAHGAAVESKMPSQTSRRRTASLNNGSAMPRLDESGWEILVVSDGSTDGTVDKVLEFARDHQLSEYPVPVPGPRTPKPTKSTKIPHGSIRLISLETNRGKGGAVTHGMRHVRGKYVLFVDADGASEFKDLGKLVERCQGVENSAGKGIAIGSRSHLVGSEAVVKRSKLRNLLMHSFHLFLRLMTTPATSRIGDTQCGFKLFSRPSLPDIVPFMHCESWHFDVEMLMLAESSNVSVAEVPIGWKEVSGSKLNVIWASLEMAWGLAMLRCAWAFSVYRKET